MKEDWKTDKFKNQIQYKSGYTWSKEQELKTQEPNSVRVLTVTNIQKDLDLSEELYLQGVSEKYKKEKAASKDWCIAVSSNGNRKRIGNAVFIKDDTDYLFASFLTAFKPKDNSEILPDYFFRWLSSHNVQERITSVSEGTTGLGNLDIRYLRNMDIHFPEKHEQSAIAAMLSKVDETIASVQASISAAERLKKSLMQNLLTGRMKPDGTLRKEDEFYVDEKFGRVPVGWEVKRIDEISERKTEVIDPTKTKEVYDYIGLEHIVPDEFVRCGKGLSNETVALKVKFEKGDLLYGKLRPYLNKVFISDISGVGSTEFIVLKQNEFTNWVYLNFQLKRFLDYTKSMTAGTQHPRASWKDIKHYLVGIPKDEQEREQITRKLLSIEQQKTTNDDKIAVLERLKKSLMQNLLTGKVRVNKKQKDQ